MRILLTELYDVEPEYVNAASTDSITDADATLVIGDPAMRRQPDGEAVFDLGETWTAWTGLPFVFAVWVANRTLPTAAALGVHTSLIESRNWGLAHLDVLAREAAAKTGVAEAACADYLAGLDYGLSYPHLGGLTEFYRRLTLAGRVAPGRLSFLPAA